MAAKRAKPKAKPIAAFKCVRPDGTDFRTGTLNYAAALADGKPVEVLDAAPANGNVCGHGIHVSPTARQTIQFAERSRRPWRWFEGTVAADDVIEKDANKMRVRRFKPTKEIFLADIFGADFEERIEAAKAESKTWKSIPWLKPTSKVSKKQIEALVKEWREALTPWIREKSYPFPVGVRIVNTAVAAAEAAVVAAAEVAAAAAEAAVAAEAEAAVAAVAAVAAEAAEAEAAVAAVAAVAAEAAAEEAEEAAAAEAAALRRYYGRWYVRPYYVLWRFVRWNLAGLPGRDPWKPLVELYRLGCLPIGFVGDEFVVYYPHR